MNALFLMVLWLFQSAAQQTGCCSSTEFSSTVENTFISCPTNTSCHAECYRGFIFPTGQTNESFSCQKGVWTPILSACKVIPEVSVIYSTIWALTDIIPHTCENISTHLNTSGLKLEETFANQCKELIIHRSVKFTYSMMAFMITGNFSFEYTNFTNWEVLNRCTNITINSLTKSPLIWRMFDNVTCNKSRVNYTISKELYILDRHTFCLNGMEIYNVTVFKDGNFELYCDIYLPAVTTEMIEEENTLNRNNLEITTIVHVTNTKMVLSSTFWGFNSILYVTAAVGGVILISVLVIFVVCLKTRLKSSKKPLRAMEMIYSSQQCSREFKGELIENKLYQSADDVVDCQRDHVPTQSSVKGSFTEPYYKNLQTKLESDEDPYSYASQF